MFGVFKNNFITFVWSFPDAIINGVIPFLFLALMFAPAFSKSSTVSSLSLLIIKKMSAQRTDD